MDREEGEEKAGKSDEKFSAKWDDKKYQSSYAKATDDRHYHHNKAVAITLAVIAVVLVVGGVAAVGAAVFNGERGGKFEKVSVQRTGGYGMMGGRYARGGMMGGGFRTERRGEIEGKITKVDNNNLTINNGSSDIQVSIQDTTSIYNSTGGIISKGDLKVDNQIIVRGSPNSSGVVQAVLIQIKS